MMTELDRKWQRWMLEHVNQAVQLPVADVARVTGRRPTEVPRVPPLLTATMGPETAEQIPGCGTRNHGPPTSDPISWTDLRPEDTTKVFLLTD